MLLPVPRNTHAVPVHMQVSVIRKVEIDLEAALEKLKGAAKDLTKGQRESVKLLAEDQKEYTKYTPGAGAGCCLLGHVWLRGCRAMGCDMVLEGISEVVGRGPEGVHQIHARCADGAVAMVQGL